MSEFVVHSIPGSPFGRAVLVALAPPWPMLPRPIGQRLARLLGPGGTHANPSSPSAL